MSGETSRPDSERAALEAMARFGGSFARNLAFAWMAADGENRARLRTAFPELLEQYAAMAAQAGAA